MVPAWEPTQVASGEILDLPHEDPGPTWEIAQRLGTGLGLDLLCWVAAVEAASFLAAMEAAGFAATMAAEAETWSLAWQQQWAQWLQG